VTGRWWEYVAVFAASLFLSWVLTPFALRLAVRRGLFDQPADHKSHVSPVPYLGGLAIVAGLSIAVLLAAAVRPPAFGLDELAWALAIALGLAVVGLIDDLRSLPPLVRVAGEIGAGFGVWAIGAGAEFTGNSTLNCIVTVVWVVGITNAVNLLDNMDGLSAGVSAIAAGSFGVIAAVNGQFLVAGLGFALAGCALGFLRHNFHPARIFMGDSGSLYLGFVLAYLGLKLRFDAPDDVTFLVPIVVLAIPILDTTLVTITRLARHQSPFIGGRDHLSHRLVRVGLPVRVVVGTIYVVQASLGVMALVISRVDRTSAYLLAGLVLVLLVMIGVLVARVPIQDETTALRPLGRLGPAEGSAPSTRRQAG